MRLLVVFLLLGVLCSNCPGGDFASGVARVETDGGTGSGFVVATNTTTKRFEVWTNGHVTGPVGTRCIVRFNEGRTDEVVFPAEVAWRQYDKHVDAAKLIAVGVFDGKVFMPASGSGNRVGNFTVGHPHGGRAYALRLTDIPNADYASVLACVPASIPGQSGSPVEGEDGKVSGVISLYFTDPKTGRRIGGYLPIGQWTGEGRVSNAGFGEFRTLENAKPKRYSLEPEPG